MSDDKTPKKKRGSVLQRLGLINTKELVKSSTPGGAEPPPGTIAAIALRGILKKQSLNNALLWQARWCVVDPDRHEFVYWNKEEEEATVEPSFRIRLGDTQSVEYIFDVGANVGSKIRFVMKPGFRPPHMIFRCRDNDEAAKWMKMLKKHKDEALGLCEVTVDEPEYKINLQKVTTAPAAAAKGDGDSDDGLSSDDEVKEEVKPAVTKVEVPDNAPPPSGSPNPCQPPPLTVAAVITVVPQTPTAKEVIQAPDTPRSSNGSHPYDSAGDSDEPGKQPEKEALKEEETTAKKEEPAATAGASKDPSDYEEF